MAEPPARTPLYRRLSSGVFRDVRSALIAIAVTAIVGGLGLLLGGATVRLDAWVLALAVAAPAILVFLACDARLAKMSGQLDEARERASAAERRVGGPVLSDRSREVLALIHALARSVERRTQPYAMLDTVGLNADEKQRFERIVRAARGIMPVSTRPTEDALDELERSGVQNAAACLGALDELKARVKSYGERDEADSSVGPSATRVVIE